MVNVLVIGATGYVGRALTQSLIRSGDHRVYGLARTQEKAFQLEKDEVIPIIGSISDNANLLSAIESYHINTVVDVAGANHESHVLLSTLKGVGASRLAVASSAGIRVPKLGFIYCSGTWVHGSSHVPVNDLAPVGALNAPTPPTQLTSWRPKLEQEVLSASDVLDTMVVRPALVYGRAGAIWSSLLETIHKAAQSGASSVSLIAEPNSRPGLVHVDDVASGFHAAIDKLPLISGTGVYPVFDLVTSQESMKDILESAARELGFKGKVELVGTGEDLFAAAMSVSGNVTSGRAKQILGWQPKRFGYVQNMDVYAKAWVAAKL
jgi:nucleoside-diphosphate-sugar epimerase